MRRNCVGLIVGLAVLAASPGLANDKDREIAGQIAEVMRLSGVMQEYDMGIKYKDGTAWLRGEVANEEQLQTAVEIAEASPHVDRVVNQLEVAPPNRLVVADEVLPVGGRASGRMPAVRTTSAPIGMMPPRRSGRGPVPFAVSSLPGSPQHLIRPVAGIAAAPVAAMASMAGPGPQPAYVPGTGGGVAPATYDQPSLPGYAWPSYAAYPNYASLTYPKQYSPTAWPYIGPFYPYPQVPLGWRKVTLEWDDGWWMLDFKNRR
jgi:hypothetical protein